MRALCALAITLGLCAAAYGHAWDDDAAISQWYQFLTQPDNPTVSCCGQADAYWADSFEVDQDGNYVAVVTDERDDTLPDGRTRMHIQTGTRIIVPNAKIKWDQGNPTGHGIVFMPVGRAADVIPYCFLPPGGV
jgi:hypothetical protein